MPKTRCKGRKAPRPAVKAADPPSAQIKTEPEETSCTTYNAPVANMSIDVQVEEEDTTPSEGSEPGILVDTSSLTEEAAIDASCSEPILSESRTIQHGLPLLDSPTPLERQQNSAWWAQEKWTSLSAYLGQDPTAATYPNAFGLVMTPGEAQRDMPVPGQYRSESSSIQSFPSQAAHRQFDYESTASHGFANRMCPHGTFTRSPPDRPIAPKVENFCHPTFAASSTGLEGAWSADPDYQGLQTDSLWNAQIEPLVYTPAAHPSMPCTNNSFSSVGSGTSFSSGHTWNGGNQAPMPACHQGLDEDLHHLNLRAVSAPQYQHLGVNTPSVGNPDLVNPYLYTTDFRSHNPLDAENRLDSSSHHQRQL